MSGQNEPEFEAGRLDAYLRSAIPGLAGEMRLQRIAGGQSNPTFFLTFDNRDLVLRKQPPGDLLPSAHAVDREFRIISALASTPVPVPPAVLFCEDISIVGTPFYIMERVDGRIFHDCTLPGVSPEHRRAIYHSLATMLAAFHRVNPAQVGLADYGRSGGYFERQIRRWTRQWTLSKTREDANIDRLIDWLPAHIPTGDAVSLIHGDYRIGNAMFGPDQPAIVALLDWELSTIGHPLADLAHCAIAWLSRPDEFGGMRDLDLETLGIPSLAQFEDIYCAAAGHGLRLEAFHLAFAFFRWAIIFEGIAARAQAGNAADAHARDNGRLAGIFAEKAVSFI